ncbi:Nitroreductase [Actinopolyspora xinjiangensis]|uniref:Nitroreductase n=1 Tax=Actinopolyspora xinjiangensis TaxID=405564 RepID=A0A1H0WR32_9ACTN|nr:nitroreductase family protein [Actinopolyspora xinjiangensis]SDP93147.1 Nitroreductase [Actinopolyspora xinjiangensis]
MTESAGHGARFPVSLETLRRLRATRWFTDAEVTESDLRSVLEVARWTGSARNRQPWRVHTVRDPDTRAELADCGGYALHLGQAPVVVLLALDRRGADAEFDGGRFAQNLMTAAGLLGLGCCPATFFPEANVERVTALAGFGSPWSVRTGIALGWPALAPPGRSAIPRGRLPLDSLWSGE